MSAKMRHSVLNEFTVPNCWRTSLRREDTPPYVGTTRHATSAASLTSKHRRLGIKRTAMNELGKMLVVIGLVLVVVGVWLWAGLGKGWLGRLPGDIHYVKGNFNFYFPIATCLLLSLVATILLWLFRK